MKAEQQNNEFTNEQREEILQKEFIRKHPFCKDEKAKITDIIDSVIYTIKEDDDKKTQDCIRKYWFTKQIEEWKKEKHTEEDPEDDDLMEIVKEDLKIRIANTILELRKHNDIKQGDILFYQTGQYVFLRHNNDDICQVSDFNYYHNHTSPPYKPFFMKNPNDNNKLNGVCIYKHGDDKKKTKWIMACLKDRLTKPQCKITFKTNKNNKIKNVEIETAKDKNSKSIYTISLNNKTGKVEKITKKGGEVNNADCIEEINNLLFKDDIFKVLRERIENELDNQQKVVFDKIKEHLSVVKEEKKEEEKKEENKDEEKEEKKEEEKREEEDRKEENKAKEEEIKEKEEANNKNGNTNAIDINNQQSNTSLKEVNTRKWFGRYTTEDGHRYFSCGCFDIPLQW